MTDYRNGQTATEIPDAPGHLLLTVRQIGTSDIIGFDLSKDESDVSLVVGVGSNLYFGDDEIRTVQGLDGIQLKRTYKQDWHGTVQKKKFLKSKPHLEITFIFPIYCTINLDPLR